MTNTKICSIKFENKGIIKLIKGLDPCKAHGYDDISIRMFRICDSATVKPLTILFKNCISQGIFPGDEQIYSIIAQRTFNSSIWFSF